MLPVLAALLMGAAAGGEDGPAAPASCERIETAEAARSAQGAPARLVPQLGHGDSVVAAALSRDGRLGITGGWDNTARIWDVRTGGELRSLQDHGDWVRGVALSADGALAFTGSYDTTAGLWDVATGRRLLRIQGGDPGEPVRIRSVALSDDGRLGIVGGEETAVRIWDLQHCHRLHRLETPGFVVTVDLSADGNLAAAGTENGWVSVWETAAGRLLAEFEAHRGAVSSIDFSDDGRRLLTASGATDQGFEGDRKAILWDPRSGDEIRPFGPLTGSESALHSARFTSDAKILTSDEFGIYLWNPETGAKVGEASEPMFGFHAVATSLGSRCVLAAGLVGAMLIEVEKQELCAPMLVGAVSPVVSVAADPEGGSQVLAAAAGQAIVWDLARGREIRRFAVAEAEITSADWSTTHVVTGDSEGALRIWDRVSGAQLSATTVPETLLTKVAFKNDGRAVAAASGERFAFTDELEPYDQDYSFGLWDMNGRRLRHFAGSGEAVTTLLFSPDGGQLYSGGESLVELASWSTEGRSSRRELDIGEPASVLSLATAADLPALLAVGTSEWGRIGPAIRFLDTRSPPAYLLGIAGPPADIAALALTPDGKELFAGGPDGLIRRYSLPGGSETAQLSHGAPVSGLALLPGGRLVSGAVDGSLVLWSLAELAELARLVSFHSGSWLVVDGAGHFDTNDFDAMGQVRWLLEEDPLTPLPIEILTRNYYVPRLLQRIVRGEKIERGLSKRLNELNIAQPKVEIVQAQIDPKSPREAVVTIAVGAGSHVRQTAGRSTVQKTGAFDLRLFRDGQLVGELPAASGTGSPGLERWRSVSEIPLDGKKLQVRVKIPAANEAGSVRFTAYAFNEDRVKSATSSYDLPIPKAMPVPRGRAFVVVIAVGDNAAEGFRLYTAGNDGQLTREVIPRLLAASGRFEKVTPISLVSRLGVPADPASGTDCSEIPPTKANIRAVFETLAGKRAALGLPCRLELPAARPEDTVFIHFSGHGYARQGGGFHLLPQDMEGVDRRNLSTEEALAKAISSEELRSWIRDLDAGDLLLTIDACQAAAIVESHDFRPGPLGEATFGQLAYDKRMTILAATQAGSDAYGGGKTGGYGLLTYALLKEGLEDGSADFRPKDGGITVEEWLQFALERVPGLSVAEQQVPELFDFSKREEWLITRMEERR